jgi:hypothetical protein
LCLSSLVLHFSDNSFLVHHPVNWDDRHLLANAKATDFSVGGCKVSVVNASQNC